MQTRETPSEVAGDLRRAGPRADGFRAVRDARRPAMAWDDVGPIAGPIDGGDGARPAGISARQAGTQATVSGSLARPKATGPDADGIKPRVSDTTLEAFPRCIDSRARD